jgi:peroxiredoxin
MFRQLFRLAIVFGISAVPAFMDCRAEENAERDVASAELLRLKLTLVRSPRVQTELGLSPRQKATVQSAVEEADLPLWQLRNASAEVVKQRLTLLDRGFDKELSSSLDVEQLGRLSQLCWRWKGISMVSDTKFVEKIGLSNAQQERINSALKVAKTSKVSAVADTESKILAVFTAPQRERLTSLLGPSFDFRDVRDVAVHAPEIAGIEGWVNSQPLKMEDLQGKVVVLTFWTFNCINCIHNLPIYQAWYDDLPKDKVVILGIHTPELASERDFVHLKQAVKQRGLKYPVAMDLRAKTWNAWGNTMWPATYVIDRHGDVRAWWSGELRWNGAEGDKILRRRVDELVSEKDITTMNKETERTK